MSRGYGSFSIAVSNMERKRKRDYQRAMDYFYSMPENEFYDYYSPRRSEYSKNGVVMKRLKEIDSKRYVGYNGGVSSETDACLVWLGVCSLMFVLVLLFITFPEFVVCLCVIMFIIYWLVR